MANKLLLTAFSVVLLDQLSKFIFKTYFSATKNHGAAFGLFQGYRWLFIAVALVVLFFVFRFRNRFDNLALGFLLGGTLGNLIDRLIYGFVIDFIDIGFWPSFNIADLFSTLGVLLLIYLHWKD